MQMSPPMQLSPPPPSPDPSPLVVEQVANANKKVDNEDSFSPTQLLSRILYPVLVFWQSFSMSVSQSGYSSWWTMPTVAPTLDSFFQSYPPIPSVDPTEMPVPYLFPHRLRHFGGTLIGSVRNWWPGLVGLGASLTGLYNGTIGWRRCRDGNYGTYRMPRTRSMKKSNISYVRYWNYILPIFLCKLLLNLLPITLLAETEVTFYGNPQTDQLVGESS